MGNVLSFCLSAVEEHHEDDFIPEIEQDPVPAPMLFKRNQDMPIDLSVARCYCDEVEECGIQPGYFIMKAAGNMGDFSDEGFFNPEKYRRAGYLGWHTHRQSILLENIRHPYIVVKCYDQSPCGKSSYLVLAGSNYRV